MFISPVLPSKVHVQWVKVGYPFELTEFSVLVMCSLQLIVSASEDSNTYMYTQCMGTIDVFKSCVMSPRSQLLVWVETLCLKSVMVGFDFQLIA